MSQALLIVRCVMLIYIDGDVIFTIDEQIIINLYNYLSENCQRTLDVLRITDNTRRYP